MAYFVLCTGVQQGDPLGPFFFALGLAAATDLVLPAPSSAAADAGPAPPSTSLSLFYLDDGNIIGPLHEVVQVVVTPRSHLMQTSTH